MALGLLEQKIHARPASDLDLQPAQLLHPQLVQPLRVRIDRAARRMAGYRYGRLIADNYISKLSAGDGAVQQWLMEENDPRLTEIVASLENLVHLERV